MSELHLKIFHFVLKLADQILVVDSFVGSTPSHLSPRHGCCMSDGDVRVTLLLKEADPHYYTAMILLQLVPRQHRSAGG